MCRRWLRSYFSPPEVRVHSTKAPKSLTSSPRGEVSMAFPLSAEAFYFGPVLKGGGSLESGLPAGGMGITRR